jgi:hypothetical protein
MTADPETAWDNIDPDPEWFDPDTPSSSGYQERPHDNYRSLFDAPNLTDFVKEPRGKDAREYESKARAFLKTAVVNALGREQYADAATYLYYGPGLASATGQLASADDRAKKILDFVTSPANPYVLFAFAAAPMVTQLLRNHEVELGKLPEARRRGRAQRKAAKAARVAEPQAQATIKIKIPFLRKEIPVRINVKRILPRALDGFRAQTTEPETLVNRVFSDPALIKELKKQGFHVGYRDE